VADLREPTPAERARLIADPAVLDAIRRARAAAAE